MTTDASGGNPAPNLRRVPVADGLDPAGPRPGVSWSQRQTQLVGWDQYWITVPCVLARPAEPGVHAALTAELHRRWVARAGPRRWQITSVVAAFSSSHSRRAHLTLAITASAPDGLNDPQIGRDLDGALALALSARAPVERKDGRP